MLDFNILEFIFFRFDLRNIVQKPAVEVQATSAKANF